MILETERLQLRPWEESDAEVLFTYAKDERVGPMAGWPVHTSVENSREIIKNVLATQSNYAVVFKGESAVIGSAGLMLQGRSNLELQANEGEIGYWLGVPHWGQGLIPEAVRELIRYGFEELGLEVLWCGYYDGNEKSHRVQEKCGFVYHHTNDHVVCSLLNEVRTEHVSCLRKEDWLKGL